MDYADWVARHPPPSLLELVAAHGNFSNITPAAWDQYDRAMRAWYIAYRWRHQDEAINRYRDRRGRHGR